MQMARHGGSLRKPSMWKLCIGGLVGLEASLCYPAALSKAKFVDQNIKRIIAFRLLLFRASGS